jgi:thioredoxin 1
MEFAVPLNKKTTMVLDTSRTIEHIETVERRAELIANNDIVVVKYSAEWCGPCKKIAPEYLSMCQTDIDGVVYCEEDVDDELGPYACEIKSIPSFHIFNKGEFVSSCKGSDMTVLAQLIVDTKNIK